MSEPNLSAAVEVLLSRVTAFAAAHPDVIAVALVGSYARGTAHTDSDVDLVLLTRDPEPYVNSDAWAPALGAVKVDAPVSYGLLTERRFWSEDALEVELNIGTDAWAEPATDDEGTRKVARAGLRILYDPQGKLAALAKSCA